MVGTGQNRRRQPALDIRFRKLDLVGQAVHTLTSPSIAYGLLVVGLALIVFEFFTISIGWSLTARKIEGLNSWPVG